MRIASPRTIADSWAVRGAIASLVLAYVAEVFSRDLGVDAVVLLGYVLAGVIFVITDRRDDAGVPAVVHSHAVGKRRAVLLAACVVLAVALNLVADVSVYDDLRAGGSSFVGAGLWLVSLVLLVAAAVVVRPLPTWSAAWASPSLPTSIRVRRALIATLALVVVGACVARLVDLDRVPWGINADEGDRASSAMSLLTGEAPRNLFGSGWFYISNVYFWLLAGVMKVLGVGFAQARVLGAISSVLTLCVVVWIAFRHFSARVAVLAAIIGATLAVSLQFARETTEATPTALLWAVSVAFLLEGGLRGGTWPWLGAGISGGLSLYFYPSGRLWVVLVALVCLHLVLRAGSGRRRAVAAGTAATALAAALTLGPFLANARAFPGQLLLRASQTSVFSDDNATRLAYYNPHWNTAQLVWAQVRHSLAVFANTGDGGGFWPTDKPILGPLLTVLVAVGLGWFTLSWRHTPRFTLALWFWVGFGGMALTVETPNLQRMATAVPVLPLLAASVIDTTALRLARLSRAVPALARAAPIVVGGCALALAAGIAAQQAHFYFATYAQMFRWPQPTIQGRAVADQGRDSLVLTVGRDWGQSNSGWVRLLAPHVDRGGLQSPGSALPLPLPADRDLSFVLYPDQRAYLGYLQAVYPGGSIRNYTYKTEGTVVSVYRVPRALVAARTGGLATPSTGRPVHVRALGAMPHGVRLPSSIRWSADLYVPAYWDYSLRLAGGPAVLRVDGKTLLTLRAGRPEASVTVALARGRHFVTLEGAAASPSGAPRLEWRTPVGSEQFGPPGFGHWRPVAMNELAPAAVATGLFATVRGAGVPFQQRLDGTLATCCLNDDVDARGRPFVVHWVGTLHAPRTGVYSFALFTQGTARLMLDGRRVIHSPSSTDLLTRVLLRLRAGGHAVDLRYRVTGSGGAIELAWAPPGELERIVPPTAFEPPPGAGVGSRVPLQTLSAGGDQPVDTTLVRR